MAKKEKKKAKAKEAAPAKTNARENFFHRNLFPIIIFAFTCLLYANTIPNSYNLDDELVTRNHPLTSKGITAIPRIFTSTYYNDGHYAYEYRPVVLATFAIEHTFFGDDPHVSHLINLLLYGLCCVVLYNTLRKIWPAINPLFHLAVTLLFIAHPAHTEDVASIKNRDEILALTFSLLALQTSLRVAGERKWWQYLLTGALFLLALLSKLTVISMVVIIPITLILFTETSWTGICLLTALLFLPVALITYSNPYDKASQLAVILLALYTLWLLVKPGVASSVWQRVKHWALSLVRDRSTAQDEGTGALLKPGTGLKPLITGMVPDRQVFSVSAILISLLLLGITLAGLVLHSLPVLIAGVVILLTCIAAGNRALSWWCTIWADLLVILGLVYFHLGMTFYNDLVVMILIYQLFFGRRDLLIPAALAYITLAGINATQYHYWQPSIFYFLLFLSLRWKYTWPVTVVLLFLAAQSPYYYLTDIRLADDPHHPIFSIYIEYYGGLLALITAVVLFLRRSLLKYLAMLFGAGCLSILLYLQVTQGEMHLQNSVIVAHQLVEDAKGTPNSLVPGAVNRPLTYIEWPVRDSSNISQRLGTSTETLFIYLHKTVLPWPMAFYYGYRFIEPDTLASPIAIAGLVLYLLLFVWAIGLLRKDKMMAYALLLYLVSIISFSDYFRPVPGMIGDRFMLIPSLGWCLLFVWLVAKIFKIDVKQMQLRFRDLPAIPKYLFILLLVAYSGLTFARNLQWKDKLTLYTHDIHYVHNSVQANILTADEMVSQSISETDTAQAEKMREEAAQYFQQAEHIDSSYLNLSFDMGRLYTMIAAHMNDLDLREQTMKYDELAKKAFTNAIRIDSNYVESQYYLALIHDQQNELDEAIPLYWKVIQIEPDKIEAYNNLAYDYVRQNKYMESIAVNRLALQRIPGARDPVFHIAHTYFAINQFDSAFVWMEKSYAIAPNDHSLVEALYDLSLKLGYADKATYYKKIMDAGQQGQ